MAIMFPVQDIVRRRTFPFVNLLLIAANVIIFVISLTNFNEVVDTYGFTPARWSAITVFTSMFLHGGIDHIFGNMWYLWIFGDNVEDRFGHVKYLIIYLVFGVVAVAMQYMTDTTSIVPMIGASGAISGVMGAYLVFFPKAKVNVVAGFFLTTVPAIIMIGFWFVLQLFLGVQSFTGGVGSGVAYWAHIGGFIAGMILALPFKLVKRNEPY